MIKTILVPLTGTDSDAAALDTAYMAARPFDAHIACICPLASAVQFAARTSAFEAGAAMTATALIESIEKEHQERIHKAHETFLVFCQKRRVPVTDVPPGPNGVSAAWREIRADEITTVIEEAFYHDLVVMGRAPDENALSTDGIGAILVACGRPVLVASTKAPEAPAPTIAVAWKNTAEAARALGAAVPLLGKAGRVILLTANEGGEDASEAILSMERAARNLRWHGLDVEVRLVITGERDVSDAVLQTALSAKADLLVMGGYGHSRLREYVFGGFTRQALADGRLPLFLFH